MAEHVKYTSVEELRKNLEIEPNAKKENIELRFEEVAYNLLNNFVIRKSDTLFYRILEIECFFFSQNHQDLITYQRRADAGDWFFHFSGVDICFKSRCVLDEDYKVSEYDRETTYFGGILIRSLEKIENETPSYIMGKPQLCCNELFDKFPSICPKELSEFSFPFLEYKPLENEVNINSCGRYFKFDKGDEYKYGRILADNWQKGVCPVSEDKFSDFLNEAYRFYYDEGIERYEMWKKHSKSKQIYTARPSLEYERIKK